MSWLVGLLSACSLPQEVHLRVKSKFVTFQGKTYSNAFLLNDLKLTPNKWKANDFSAHLNDLVNALNGQVKISNGFRKRSND